MIESKTMESVTVYVTKRKSPTNAEHANTRPNTRHPNTTHAPHAHTHQHPTLVEIVYLVPLTPHAARPHALHLTPTLPMSALGAGHTWRVRYAARARGGLGP